MNTHRLLTQLALLTTMLLSPLAASAISGYYSDPGGGQYWCNVFVASVSDSKSYSWCTGDDEDASMELFRGFECDHDGKVTTEHPTLKVKYRYHHPQSKDYNYNGSDHEIYVMVHGGGLYKILEWKSGAASWTQTDFSFGVIGDLVREGEWFTFRFAPNERGLQDIVAIQIENNTYYYQDNVFVDYSFVIHARYLKSVSIEPSQAHDATVTWSEPGKVKVSADNSWLPQDIGNNVENFSYKGSYEVVVNSDDKMFSRTTLEVENRGNGEVELVAPLDKDFTVDVTRNTLTSFRFNGHNISQNLNENVTKSQFCPNSVRSFTASFNQVDAQMLLQWDTGILNNTGEWKVYRTELDEHGNYLGNRELVGSTSGYEFTDNPSRGLQVGKYYRYEIYHHENSWPEIDIPSNPEPLTTVHPAQLRTSTVPVIPLHLVQDQNVTDKIKMDWTFGNVPKSENDVTFKVHRIEPNGTITHNYLDVTVPRNAGKASFSDEKPESNCSVYGYFLQLDLNDNKVHLYSDTVSAHVHEGTTVTRVDASKGTGGNAVVVKWRAKQVGTIATLFNVQRRFVGGGEWVTIHEQEGTGSSYTYTDNTAEPGRYYDYRVVAYAADCGDESFVINNAMTDVGYAQSTGTVSGRVQFDTGTAVDNVRVTLSRESDEQARSPYYSRQIIDDDGGLVWQTDTLTAQNMLSLTKPFTVQMWINPVEQNISGSYLFSIMGHDAHPFKHTDGYSVRLRTKDGGYGVTINSATQGSEVVTEFRDIPSMPEGQFSHLTIRNNGNGSIECIVNGDIEHKQVEVIPIQPFTFPPDEGSVVNVVFASGSYYKDMDGYPELFYKGYVDEIRFWNRAITDAEITTNYDRILSGREEGLKLYWTFDEGLEEHAFDNSSTNGVPNGNHAILGNTSRPSEIVPSSDKLSSYGVTNDKGEYEIRGIPFTGSGTRYSVYPTKGVHSFSPTSRSAFIGGTSLNINNVDFTDVSSFKVSGTILYSGTTIPVDSVSFYIDGAPCNKNDKLIVSDANGHYEISVPIGSHYIEARRVGHTFEGAGRYPAMAESTYEFLEDTHIDFYDNTTAIMAGRVTGGETEGTKPLGYGVSKNTIGKAVIKLSPLDHPQRMLNAVQHIEGATSEWVPNAENVTVESASTAIGSTAYRAGGSIDEAKYIYITTDSETGEFSAIVPPIRYRVESVKFPNNSALESNELFMNVPAINMTNPRDSVIPDTLYTEDRTPLPLFRCNKKLMLTYRSNPVMDITQMGAPLGAFGTDTILVHEAHQDIKLPAYSYDEETHSATYNYGYPVFEKGRTYEFKVRAYEPYLNYDASATGRRYEDLLCDSVVTFDNEIGEAARIAAIDQEVDGHNVVRGQLVKLEREQVKLDENGEGRYKWVVGIPSLNAPYTRTMNASMVINDQTKLWRNTGLEAIITGVVPTGNNFITAGPSHVQMVLRDPPGDASTATWGTDTVTCNYSYHTYGIHQGTEFAWNYNTTLEFGAVSGTLVFAEIFYNTLIHENTFGISYNIEKTWDHHTSVTLSHNHSTSTSASPILVGRDGDVFIGYSTNYIIGAADKIGPMRQDDGSWAIGMEETISMDEKFNTHFQYTQSYIENTLFKNINRTRNSMLKHINSLDEIEEEPAVPTYYTLLTENDPKYGTSNDDAKAWGSEAAEGMEGPSYYARFPNGYEGCDSVRWCNEIVEQWKKTLADNEEDKIKAFNDPKMKVGNESFERGVTVTNSTSTVTKDVENSTENFKTTLAYKGKNGYLLGKWGSIFITNVDIGYHHTKQEVNETTTTELFSYTLNDTQRGNAHTVDIFNSPRAWSPIFRTRGGQTRCPYEGERVTKYYNPGTILDYATMKLDNPHIQIPVRNYVDIPAGQSASVEIRMTNDSETHDQLSSVLVYVDPASNPNGLQVTIDGDAMVDGHEVWLEYGTPLIKTLSVKQTDQSILDYENVKIQLLSTCEYMLDPASSIMGRTVYDEQEINVHFTPAAPEIKLTLDKNVLNQHDVQSGEQVKVTISDINRFFTGFKGVRLKYRFAGDNNWITAHEWITNVEYLPDGQLSDVQSMLSDEEPNINYTLVLPNIDGNYVVVAESMSVYGGKEYTKPTPEKTVTRDTRGPKLLGQAYPNAGILTPTDDIRIKFNEDIRESYLTKETNFFITGSLNDAQVSHDVSLQFNGTPVETDAYLPIANTSFASSLWLKRLSSGTILEHGTEGNSLSLSINDQGKVEANINGKVITSQAAVPMDKWVFLALNYVKGAMSNQNTFTMIMANEADETMLFDEAIVPDYNGIGQLTLGRNFTGMMHELVLWNKNNPVRTQLGQKDEAKAPYLPGLVGYWKMNEGHGTVVTDYARARNIHLPAETWNVENTNLAAHLDGESVIKIPIGSVSPRPSDSYVVETWFRGEKDKNARATLLSVTDRVSIGFDYDNSMLLHVYNDTLSSLISNGLPIVLTNVNYNDGNWHHLALNVHRGVSAVVYVDGSAVKTIAEQQLPAPAGDYLYVGGILKRNPDNDQFIEESYHFTGDIDEIRVWNVACDGTSVIANRYNQVDTAQVTGLIAYYPMEHSSLDANGNIVTEFSLENSAPNASQMGITHALGDGVTQAITAPALRTSPLKQNLDFDYTASNNEIYINLLTLPSRMQGNLLTFVVKNVRDMYDNISEPITWSAVVDYNTLEWNQESIVVDKDRLSEFTAQATLHNKGRENGKFSITGLPTWIQPSETSGVLAIDETIPVQFTIGADAPVGTHLVYAYAVNDGDICAPLLFNVTVRGNEPSWTVNPDDYESSMNMIGQIYLDDKICTNTNTKIAAFVDNNCCGVASPKLVTSRDAYFVSMTIYGLEDITSTKPITFRIYDAERGVVLGNVKTKLNGETLSPTYLPNGLVGDYDNPVVWQPSDLIEQQCNLANGWNWISLYVQPEQGKADLESLFGHAKVFNTIKGKEGFAMNSGTKWTSTGLDTLAIGNLYKLKVKNDINHSISGTMIDTRTTTQAIYPGWNWIGPLSIYNLSLNEAFADLQPTRGDIVKSKTQVAFYDGYKWEGDLTAIVPGMGYYYKSCNSEPLVFVYPTIDATTYQAPAVMMNAPRNLPFTPVDHHEFSDNMNVVAQVVKGDIEVNDLCIAAFVDGECRGVTTATEDGLYMLTIAGNADEAGKTVRFATVYNGEEVWFSEELQWLSDWIYGDLDEPQVFDLNNTSGIDNVVSSSSIIISPAVVQDVINVKAGDILKEVNIYSVNGKLLDHFTPDDNQAMFNLSHLIDGVYFVEARTYSGTRAIKQILKR